MLIEFSVSNFLSFNELTTFQLSSNLQSLNDISNIKVLQTIVIYGTNNSGKTNMIKALNFMKDFILLKLNLITEKDKYDELVCNLYKKRILKNRTIFLLNKDNKHKESVFEIKLLINNCVHTYGFKCNNDGFLSEWESIQYKKDIDKNHHLKTLSSKDIVYDWFKNNASFLDSSVFRSKNIPIYYESIESFNFAKSIILNADLGITDISIKNKRNGSVQYNFYFNGIKLNVNLISEKTIYLFRFLLSLYSLIKNNKLIFIDNFDDGLHPMLTRHLIDFINKKIKNMNSKAQFISIINNTALMKRITPDSFSPDSSRCDILDFENYFLFGSNMDGSTQIRKITEREDLNNLDLDKLQLDFYYLEGWFGLIPIINFNENVN